MAKRFYKDAKVAPISGGQYTIELDGRAVKTPGKCLLVIDSKHRASAVCAEWNAQEDEIIPAAMPCTRLLSVACELTPQRRPELIKEFTSYLGTDLLCYRAASPADLAKEQEQNWQPVLDWAANAHGINLAVTQAIHAAKQPQASLKSGKTYAAARSDTDLTLLLHFTASYGSAILALAAMTKYLDAADAWTLSRLDEIYQNKQWGSDADAQARAEAIVDELIALSVLI